jgi:hypothetical protein
MTAHMQSRRLFSIGPSKLTIPAMPHMSYATTDSAAVTRV